MIMAIPGAVAPVVYGGKMRAIMAYLDRTKMQARGLSPVDVMKALDSYNLFLPTGDAKFGGTDYAIDSNSMYELVKRMGDIPLHTEHGNVVVPQRRGQAGGRQFHPDQRRPRERAAAGLHPRLPPVGLQHAGRGRGPQEGPAGHPEPPEPHGHRFEGGHGPVGLRPPFDREPGGGGRAGGHPLLAGDPGLPGRVADDDHRRADRSDCRLRRDRVPVLQRPDDQRDDPGGPFPGHRAAGRYGDHFPGEHAPAPGAGGHGGGRGLPRQQRSGPAGVGRQPLHAAGAGPLGRDAGLGTVPLSPHGAGRDLRDGRGLPAVPVVRAHALRRLAAAAPDLARASTRASTTRTGTKTNSAPREAGSAGSATAGRRSSTAESTATSAAWPSCFATAGWRSPSPWACWSPRSCCWEPGSAASSSRKSTPGPSRSTCGPPAARGSKSPKPTSRGWSSSFARSWATIWNCSSARSA